jgi:hypothetical protein
VAIGRNAAVDLWHEADGSPWATFPVGDHCETWPLGARAFRSYLIDQFLAATDDDDPPRVPSAQAMQEALAALEAMARRHGAERRVYTRLAAHADAVYVDLANDQWETVCITKSSWAVVHELPEAFRFRRPRGMLALPAPQPGGSLAPLRVFTNVRCDADWHLLAGWLVGAFRPTGPYLVFVLHGQQGSGKSTVVRVLRALIDPNSAPLRAEPRDGRDLMIAATNSWVVALDNLSRLDPWLSDSLCRLATGGGFATRQLYSDNGEMLFDAARPCVLNGIEELATRGDLLDRSILLYLPAIDDRSRRAEATFWRDFEAARPSLLGALCDAVSRALAEVEQLDLGGELPRMADATLWIEAAAPALGLKPGAFLAAYQANRAAANSLALDASPVVGPLRALADRGRWQGTATELLGELNALASEALRQQKAWPRSGQGLSNVLRRLLPNLGTEGLHVEVGLATKRAGKVVRLVVVEAAMPPRGRTRKAAHGSVNLVNPSTNGRNTPKCG